MSKTVKTSEVMAAVDEFFENESWSDELEEVCVSCNDETNHYIGVKVFNVGFSKSPYRIKYCQECENVYAERSNATGELFKAGKYKERRG